MAIIEVKDLVKTYKIIEKEDGLIGYFKNLIKPKYKEFTAVNHINFEIQEGELIGYIGENGAGKSTTIKMLTGLLTPTSGEVVVDNLNPSQNRIENNKKIGAVFGQKTQLWWDLPVIESFRPKLKFLTCFCNNGSNSNISLNFFRFCLYSPSGILYIFLISLKDSITGKSHHSCVF